ncbi:capsule assembly Wzi family protein, partial [Candidatus Poribacteria bacterium]
LRPGFLSQTDNPHAFTVKDKDYKIDLDLKLKQEVALTKSSSEDEKGTSIASASFIVRAKLGGHLGASSILDNRLLLGSAAYNPYQNEISDSFSGFLEGESRTMTSTETYGVLDFPWLAIQWGIERMWWGPGRHGALMLSDNAAPADTFKLSGLYGPFRYTYLTSILRAKQNIFDEYYPKYMSAHRLEFLPYQGISVGINEAMVFVERYDLRYLHPLLAFVTSQVGDFRSNNLLGFDVDITLLPSIELYTEVMVDDFQTSDGFKAFRLWNSKYGALVGGYWVDPFGLKDTDIRVEYVFVNQYAYTRTWEDFRTEYTNEGFAIGHWMGPDADDLWFDVKHWLTDDFRFSLTYERERQGEGDVTKRFPFVGGTAPEVNWEFLSGTAESTHSFSAGLAYVSIGKWLADIGYTYSQIRNVDHESGIDGKRHQVVIKAEHRL